MAQQLEKKHPKGLYVLFFTEMWERFGFYLMLGIFFLYMTDSVDKGGMGFTGKNASDIFGTYIALVYLTPFIGGLLADRVLGYRVAISIGGLLMAAGYIGLALPGETAFYISLLLIIVGNGFFKPNISTLLGNLYNKPEYLSLKDSGYNIFYMGINIGAFVCNFVAAYMRNNFGWGYAFAAAGVGMIIGVIWFWAGNNKYKEADIIKPTQPEDMSLPKIFGVILLPAFVAGFLGWSIPDNLFGSDSTDAFLFASIPILLFYLSLWVRASKEDKNPIAALLSIYGVVIVFWAVFHQNGTALTIWAENFTKREMPTSLVEVSKPLGMVQEIDNTLVNVPKKDSHGAEIKDEQGNVIMELQPDAYLRNLPQEEWPKDGEKMQLISTEIFQSINPFFVVFLTPLVLGVFSFLGRRGKEPSTPAKIGLGLFITALSTLVMVGAVVASDNGAMKSAGWWLIGTYGVITVGELCLSPMGLSLVSKLSPQRITALMMGGWFLSTSIGNKLSGVIASLWDAIDNKSYFFLINFAGAMIAALAIFAMLKWLRQIVYEHTGSN
jgi:proton-dependent oligopeptide transporter, POT family